MIPVQIVIFPTKTPVSIKKAPLSIIEAPASVVDTVASVIKAPESVTETLESVTDTVASKATETADVPYNRFSLQSPVISLPRPRRVSPGRCPCGRQTLHCQAANLDRALLGLDLEFRRRLGR